jgi:hypothetical protein
VGEQDDPLVADELVEVNLAIGGICLEVRRGRSESETVSGISISACDWKMGDAKQCTVSKERG